MLYWLHFIDLEAMSTFTKYVESNKREQNRTEKNRI